MKRIFCLTALLAACSSTHKPGAHVYSLDTALPVTAEVLSTKVSGKRIAVELLVDNQSAHELRYERRYTRLHYRRAIRSETALGAKSNIKIRLRPQSKKTTTHYFDTGEKPPKPGTYKLRIVRIKRYGFAEAGWSEGEGQEIDASFVIPITIKADE